MSFERSSFTVTIFELPESLPENTLELFAGHCAGTLDSVTEELQTGWVAGRNLLENQINEETAIYGGAMLVTWRKAIRKIPTTLLNAMCKRDEESWLKANNAEFIPKKVRKEIKEDIIDRNVQKFPPSVAGIPLLIDAPNNMMYLGTSSRTQIDEVIEAFQQTCQIEPLQVTPEYLLEKKFNTKAVQFPTFGSPAGMSGEFTIARDFLTCLWYFNENCNDFVHQDYGLLQVALDGPLTFADDDAECNGAAEITVKNGENPLRSAEGRTALQSGKRLKKCKLSVVREEQVWNCTFDADRFAFGSLKLPEGDQLDAESVLEERVFFLRLFAEAVSGLFERYANLMLGNESQKQIEKIQQWINTEDI